ncbi:MAG: hypothetical protein ABJQ23_21405 [Shimia thalassica]|uniref:hypothetical protein n=1 Tax=Shimia thalassica TaxID=1715693 RepID=UPI003296922D
MLGVVLWSDSLDNKAVIWCEDQGDLAYFNGGTDTPVDIVDLDAGDLVQFELQQERHLRYAKNPRRIEQGAYAHLPGDLQAATAPQQPDKVAAPKAARLGTADIIPFARRDRKEPSHRQMVLA